MRGARVRIGKVALSAIEYAGLAALVLLFVLPFLWMLATSVKAIDETMTYPPRFIPSSLHFENFANAWKSGPFLKFLLNSLVITLTVMLLQFVFTVPAAYAFARRKFRGKNLFFGLTLVTLMIPTQLIFVPMFLMFSKVGLINSYASMIAPFAASAFGIFLLRQRFMQVPEELLEAARLDGAGEFRIIMRIMLPMAKPAIVTILLLTFISRWNDYFWPMAMSTDDSVRTLAVGIAMLRETEGAASWNTLMAGNVILVLPILILFALAQRQIIQAFVYTGDK